jgi:5-oxoprolinase (ATP-hydrolysing)
LTTADPAAPGRWHFWIDRGGTFTDLVALTPAGGLIVRKVLSQQPELSGDPAVRALRQAMAVAEDEPLDPTRIAEVRLGTTVATNALLEGKGAPVLLLVNRGFADLLQVGDQHRPELFALEIVRPKPLDVRVLELEGRLAADGRELEPLHRHQELEAQLLQAWADGYRSCAIALLHSYRQPAHELAVADWLRQLGFRQVHCSHQLSRQPRLVPRLHTTVLEAALAPRLQGYLEQVGQALGPAVPLRVMTSSGALQSPALLQARDTVLSGPAGGMVGAVEAARAAGFHDRPILGFDMGGTSTDVFHCDAGVGEEGWERRAETAIQGLRLQAPMLPINTVAAGGGSVLRFDGQRLRVGPESAGADPGPICYGRGGPLTVTDANLLLGRLPVAALPALFGPRGDQPADVAAVRRGFAVLAAELGAALAEASATSPEALAHGALEIAVERMAEAIRRISIQRGHDIREAVLVSYGGAGGQHACRVAGRLGIRQVLLHPLAGVLSAWGIGLARQRLLLERSLRLPLEPGLGQRIAASIDELEAEGVAILRAAGDLAAAERPQRQLRLELRYPGSDQGLELAWDPEPAAGVVEADWLEALRRAFEQKHQQRYGYVVAGEPLVLERLSLDLVPAAGAPGSEVGGALPPAGLTRSAEPVAGAAAAAAGTAATTPLWLADAPGGWVEVPLRSRAALVAGCCLEGPAVLLEDTGTTVLEPGWRARVLAGGALVLEQQRPPGSPPPPQALDRSPGSLPAPTGGEPTPVDPVRLELYNHRFTAIAEQMGVRLQQSSRSVNIRERLDFSCALFDAAGRLVANAPHIPVHLGSMGESVVCLLEAVRRGERPPLQPGDAVACNDPFHGGTHLPDITVITPVFAAADGADPLAFVACRGHHADVGGITPGSMPPFSRSISEEGLLLDLVPLLSAGRFDGAAWRQRLLAGPYPVRNPDQLLADLQAQLAANRLGAAELRRLIAGEGAAEVADYMVHVLANAAEAVRRVIDRLEGGEHRVELDDGSHIQVAVRIDRRARRATVDFSGSAGQRPGNTNAPLAITKAVVLYVFRTLVGEPIPLNAGCFDPIDLVVPPGSLLHPRPPAAVVAGNVETSQAVANGLFAALGVMAAAQGTMNNLSFGNDRCQYYETICGGTGAGAGFAGAAAVQSHMTNSRLTDPEILEERFPVRLEQFRIRRGSGGPGRWPGGAGVVRQLCFLEPLTVALLSGSRRVPPFGLAGGGPGQCGRNRLQRLDGSWQELGGCAELTVAAGERLLIETPGGGGYGPAIRGLSWRRPGR